MNAARLVAFSAALALLGPALPAGAAAPAAPIHLSGGLPQALSNKQPGRARFEALILVASKECPCHWLETYWAAVRTIKEEDLPLDLKVIVSRPKPGEFHHLKDLGVSEEHLAGDPDGSLVDQLGLSQDRLPYLLVASTGADGTVVMALQISKMLGDQRSQGAALAFLRFLSGE